MKPIVLRLFGTIVVEKQGIAIDIARRKSLALLSYLAVTHKPQSRDVMAALLWPSLSQDRARGSLRSALYSLHTQIGVPIILANQHVMALDPAYLQVDVWDFYDCIAQTQEHGHPQDVLCSFCVELLQRAEMLYGSELMVGFSLNDSSEYEQWQTFHQQIVSRDYTGILQKLVKYHRDEGATEKGIAFAQRWLQEDPLNESAYRLLMELYVASGQRSQAIRQYQECITVLQRELATVPEQETVQLFERLISNQATVQTVFSSGRSRGYLPPMPALTIGRDNVIVDIKSRLEMIDGQSRQAKTVIQGWPGVGKSTIMATVAHEPGIAAAFPDGVLWISLGETPNILTGLQAWAKALDVDDVSHRQTPAEISALLTAVLRDKRVLLLVDDVWKVEHAAPFQIGGQHSGLVLSTRLTEVAQTLSSRSSDLYRLQVLPESSALNLLNALAPDVVQNYPDEARQLVRDLEGLPLAIQVAGRLLNSEMQLGWGIDDLLHEIRNGARLLDAQVPQNMVADSMPVTTNTVAALLKRSTDALDPLTRVRFADLGLFIPKPATFDLEAMAALWGTDNPKPTARGLVNRGLLDPLPGGRFQLHALLMLHARALLHGQNAGDQT